MQVTFSRQKNGGRIMVNGEKRVLYLANIFFPEKSHLLIMSAAYTCIQMHFRKLLPLKQTLWTLIRLLL